MHFSSRAETEPLVSGVANCIFCGYASLVDAHAAFVYAQARSWTRALSSPHTFVPIPFLPQPDTSPPSPNPLNGTEIVDTRWYVVYRGIQPGVYRSQ